MTEVFQFLKDGDYHLLEDLPCDAVEVERILREIRSKVFPRYEVLEITNPANPEQTLVRLQPKGVPADQPVMAGSVAIKHEGPVRESPGFKAFQSKAAELRGARASGSSGSYTFHLKHWAEWCAFKKEKGETPPTFDEYVDALTISDEAKTTIKADHAAATAPVSE